MVSQATTSLIFFKEKRIVERINNNIHELSIIIMDGEATIDTLYGTKTIIGIKDMIFQYMKDIILRTNEKELKEYFSKDQP